MTAGCVPLGGLSGGLCAHLWTAAAAPSLSAGRPGRCTHPVGWTAGPAGSSWLLPRPPSGVYTPSLPAAEAIAFHDVAVCGSAKGAKPRGDSGVLQRSVQLFTVRGSIRCSPRHVLPWSIAGLTGAFISVFFALHLFLGGCCTLHAAPCTLHLCQLQHSPLLSYPLMLLLAATVHRRTSYGPVCADHCTVSSACKHDAGLGHPQMSGHLPAEAYPLHAPLTCVHWHWLQVQSGPGRRQEQLALV